MYAPRKLAIQTKTALGSAGLFTSEAVDGQKYVRLTGKVFADQGGSLEIQEADALGDGTHTPGTFRTMSTVSVTANTTAVIDATLRCQFVRLKYTNGATAQGTFELSGYLDPKGA